MTITFANGFTYRGSVTITGQWEACNSDPHGCGEYLMLSTNVLLIDACGDAGLYGSTPPTTCAQGTLFDSGCPADHCPDGSALSTDPIEGGVCCICEPPAGDK